MEVKVEIISREIVKPKNPTLPHLKHHKLSLLDQLASLAYGLEFVCYASPKTNGQHIDHDSSTTTTIARLKESLSEALTMFYPIAGRLTVNESAVDCNDEGIPFVIAQCCSPLSVFLNQPSCIDMVGSFLPSIIAPGPDDCYSDLQGSAFSSKTLEVTEVVLFAVQVSIFDCGGVMIATKGLQKILDATSCGIFLQTWSNFARGVNKEEINEPNFALVPSLFPPQSWAEISPPRSPIPLRAFAANQVDGPCVAKVYEFSPQSVSALRTKASSDRVPNPTRVEVVTGFIWKHAMAAAATASTNPHVFGPSVVTHNVNMRPRLSSQVPPTAFGNLIFKAIARYEGSRNDDEAARKSAPELPELVAEVYRALSEVKDIGFLSRLQGEKGAEIVRQYKHELDGIMEDRNINTYRFTSWNKLGLDPDFGLGLPVWSGYSGGRMSSLFKNLILLMLNPSHGNIEVMLILDEKQMNTLQSDPHFLAFASLVGGSSN